MKRPRSSSYGDDFDDDDGMGGRMSFRDWPRRDQDPDRSVSSSHRRLSYSKTEGPWLVASSSSSYGRSLDGDWEPPRHTRRRYGHELESLDSRKGHSRYRVGGDRMMQVSSQRVSYGGDVMHRSESFSGLKREVPKGFGSERDRLRRDGNGSSSWWRWRSSKDFSVEEVRKSPSIDSDSMGRRSHATSPDDYRGKVRSRDSSSGLRSVRVEAKTVKTVKPIREGGNSSEMEEGELEPDLVSEAEPVAEPSMGSKTATGVESENCKDRNPEYSSLPEEVSKEILLSGKMLDIHGNGSLDVKEEGKLTEVIMDTGNTSDEIKDEECDAMKELDVSSRLTYPINMSDQVSNDRCDAVKELNESCRDGEQKSKGTNGNNEVEDKFCRKMCDAVNKLVESRRGGEGKAKDSIGDTEVEGKFCGKQEVCKEETLCSQFQGEILEGNDEEQAIEEAAKEMTSAISPWHVEQLVESKEEAKHNETKVEIEQAVEEEAKEMGSVISPSQEEKLAESKEEGQSSEAKVETEAKHEMGNEQGMETEVNFQERLETTIGLKVEQKEQRGTDLETEPKGAVSLLDQTKEVTCETNHELVTLALMSNHQNRKNYKEKGKGLTISLLTKGDLVEDDCAMEGPSGRDLELVFRSDISQADKASSSMLVAQALADEKLKIEPLDLSLALPGGLLDQSSKQSKPKPEIPSCARSIQSFPSSFRTNSDGFETSTSFTSSQPFVHNPSCSLTQNSLDNCEHSVGIHPILQGVDQVSGGMIWQAQASNDCRRKGSSSFFQRVLMNGNSAHDSHHIMNAHHQSKSSCLVQQSSLSRQMSLMNSHGSHDMTSQLNKDRKLLTGERSSSIVCRTEQQDSGQLALNGSCVMEKILSKIVAEPFYLTGRMLQEMTDHSVADLRETISEMLANTNKRRQLYEFQEELQRRSDMTMDTLINCPQVLLQILVAIKTGLPDFIQGTSNLSSSNLVEIFLNLKCRNLACRSSLPVDDCDCKVCIEKTGFCSACMCCVCSKFDNASNTCSWVGCDVCLHWCHTDCGLRYSHIRNGSSASGEGISEMQFHCVSCHHPSEMFGFVKEVFQTCAKDWKAETLAKELQYVRRIFSTSNDIRGKRLHDLVHKMLLNLEKKVNHSEVVIHILTFLSDSESNIGSFLCTPKEPSKNKAGHCNAIVCSSKDCLPSVLPGKASLLANAGLVLSMDCDRVGMKARDIELRLEKKSVSDELESVIMFKQAEAKMYQERADDARREAESLKHIAIAKNSKIDEDYDGRLKKLRLGAVEERRRQKFEELEAAEKAHREFFNMKMRMEVDIRELLLKMEATKQSLNT
ncbi:hypothetical protein MUK42_27349 [Musa troglodytarum]|uniref:Protein OBERON 4 n=1 Tax=Musa troglodytarum TaxID=320322 RepID=A0A9E7EA08_9LILI|nr:hypothetical protein MUK42_27349 [Musa troglodytarum]